MVELKENVQKLENEQPAGKVKMLTSCPSCVQGLLRFQDDLNAMEVDYIVVEMAKHLLGENWIENYIKQANDGGIERVLI